jgi:5'-deoxynucleotidase YfbR-like HD superfamily hydrolase
MLTTSDRILSGSILRWHALQGSLSRTQTVAEHCHRMGIIADALLEVLGCDKDYEGLYLLKQYIQCHDDHELITGDCPSTYKVFLKERNEALASEFAGIEESVDTICTDIEQYLYQSFNQYYWVAKLADVLEAQCFYRQYSLGHVATDKAVEASLSKALQSIVDKASKDHVHNWSVAFDFVDRLLSDTSGLPYAMTRLHQNLNLKRA